MWMSPEKRELHISAVLISASDEIAGALNQVSHEAQISLIHHSDVSDGVAAAVKFKRACRAGVN
jgi:hypothetical protein